MVSLYAILIFLVACAGLFAAGGATIGPVRRVYFSGVNLWSSWLPVVATGFYLSILAFSLINSAPPSKAPFLVSSCFSSVELIVLLFVGPLFLTRVGNFAGLFVSIYLIEQLVVAKTQQSAGIPGIIMLGGCCAIVAMIADKMPWRMTDSTTAIAARIREIVLAVLTLGAMVLTFIAIVKVQEFARWFLDVGMHALRTPVMLGLLIGIFAGWMGIALGFARHFGVAMLALPTTVIAAFVTNLPAHLLMIPFACAIALALAEGERRASSARLSAIRPAGFTWHK